MMISSPVHSKKEKLMNTPTLPPAGGPTSTARPPGAGVAPSDLPKPADAEHVQFPSREKCIGGTHVDHRSSLDHTEAELSFAWAGSHASKNTEFGRQGSSGSDIRPRNATASGTKGSSSIGNTFYASRNQAQAPTPRRFSQSRERTDDGVSTRAERDGMVAGSAMANENQRMSVGAKKILAGDDRGITFFALSGGDGFCDRDGARSQLLFLSLHGVDVVD
jgi:hypothetical protein